MLKKSIFIVGCGIFLWGLSVFVSLKTGEQKAVAIDNTDTKYGMTAEGPPPCNWEAAPPERIMSEDKSQAILIKTRNDSDVPCEISVALRAPGFDVSPPKEEQKVTLAATSSGSLSWILTPRKTGTFEISVSDVLNTSIYGVTVTTLFGLNTLQAKLLSGLSTIFGPMLTLPWWWDRLRGKKKQDNQKDDFQQKSV